VLAGPRLQLPAGEGRRQARSPWDGAGQQPRQRQLRQRQSICTRRAAPRPRGAPATPWAGPSSRPAPTSWPPGR
jgi:hypothetical protein